MSINEKLVKTKMVEITLAKTSATIISNCACLIQIMYVDNGVWYATSIAHYIQNSDNTLHWHTPQFPDDLAGKTARIVYYSTN